MAHPAVLEAAVIGTPCPVLGERAHAFVCLLGGRTTGEDLATHCRVRLADYKIPDSFSIGTDPLPRNANGKIMKRELRGALLAAGGLPFRS